MTKQRDGFDGRTGEWLSDLADFLRAPPAEPPRLVGDRVRAFVRSDLAPSARLVLAKVAALFSVAAGVVLSLCPQLGVGPIGGRQGALHLFHQLGTLGCAGACGALLFAACALAVGVGLRRGELRVAARFGFLRVALAVAVAFSALLLLGGAASTEEYAAWFVGALVAGFVVWTAVVRLRVPTPAVR